MSPEIKTEVPAEIVGEAEHEGRGRLIAVAAVVTTLLAALTGFMQASALRTHDEADARAERFGALSVNTASGNKDQAQVQIERFQLLQQEQRQEANAMAFHTYASQPSAALEATRWRSVAHSTERDTRAIAQGQHLLATCPASSDSQCFGPQSLPAVCSPTAEPKTCGPGPGQGGWYSPEQDPNFPTRYEQAAQRESYFLSAQRDASNQRADSAENRFVHFAAALTMFAVAVFLFGYSLTPQGSRRRGLFATVATAFAVVGGLWALFHALSGTPNPPLAAATAYADGEVALKDSDNATADRQLTRATQLRPEFVNAWSDLATARYGEGIPQAYVNTESTQIPSVSALRADIDADQKAIDAGSESPTVRFDKGASLLYVGLLTHNDDEVRQGRQLSADADARFAEQLRQGRHPGSFVLNADFNTAEADLVTGSPATGQEYKNAVARMLRLVGEISIESVVGAALTDLNLIAQTRPKLAGETRALADEIVAAANRSAYWDTTPGNYAHSGHDVAQLANVQIQPDPGHMQYTIGSATNLNTDNDLMSVQWEYKDPINGNWEVLPDISGTVGPGNINAKGGSSYISDNPSFIGQTSPHTCLPPGQYRADLWVNGRLAGESPATSVPWSGLHGTGFRGIDAAFCKPSDWTGLNLSSGSSLFTSADASSGAAIFVLPAKAFGNGSVADLMRTVIGGFTGGRGGPASGARPVEHDKPSYFMNFAGAREQLWQYSPGGSSVGALYSAAGISQDHELFVGLVYGSDAQSNINSLPTRLKNILLSYSQL